MYTETKINKAENPVLRELLSFAKILFRPALIITLLQGMYSYAGTATGSGFFITSDGNFVTNYHVIVGADSIAIRDVFGNTFPATVVRVDQSNDIAILKATGKFRPISIENSSSVKRGASVVAIGFPHIDVQGLEPKVTDGIVSSLTGIQDDPRYFQISAAVQSGNSGGPLLNMYGNVVGIVSAKLAAPEVLKSTGDLTQNVNYAVKSNYILEITNSLISVKAGLKPVNKKKYDDAAVVYSAAENSIGLVIAESTKPEVVDKSPSEPKSNEPGPQAVLPPSPIEEPKHERRGAVSASIGFVNVVKVVSAIKKSSDTKDTEDRINRAVIAVAEASNCDLVTYSGVAFASIKTDITDSVIRRMNYPGSQLSNTNCVANPNVGFVNVERVKKEVPKTGDAKVYQDRINRTVTEVAETFGWDLVFYSGVAYSSKTVDITDSVIRRMRR